MGLQHRDGRVLVRDAVGADLRGEGAVLRRVELELVVLDDDRATSLRILDQPVIARAQIRPPLVRPHARDDGVELREVAVREILGSQPADCSTELLEGGGHLVAHTHDVADRESLRDPHVDDLEGRGCRVVDVPPLDVRILDDLEAAIEGRAARPRHRLQLELPRRHRAARRDGKAYGAGLVGPFEAHVR